MPAGLSSSAARAGRAPPRQRAGPGIAIPRPALFALVGLKVLLTISRSRVCFVPSLLLQRFPLFVPGQFPLTAVDRWIGFHPQWIWIYESAYALMMMFPWLAGTRQALKVYAVGFLAMTGVAFLFF